MKGNKRRSRRLARRPDSFFHDWFRSQWPFSRRQLVRVIVLFRHSLHDPHCERATIETGYNECRGASSCNGGVAERPRRIRDEGTRRRIQEARYPGKESGAKEKKKKKEEEEEEERRNKHSVKEADSTEMVSVRKVGTPTELMSRRMIDSPIRALPKPCFHSTPFLPSLFPALHDSLSRLFTFQPSISCL